MTGPGPGPENTTYCDADTWNGSVLCKSVNISEIVLWESLISSIIFLLGYAILTAKTQLSRETCKAKCSKLAILYFALLSHAFTVPAIWIMFKWFGPTKLLMTLK